MSAPLLPVAQAAQHDPTHVRPPSLIDRWGPPVGVVFNLYPLSPAGPRAKPPPRRNCSSAATADSRRSTECARPTSPPHARVPECSAARRTRRTGTRHTATRHTATRGEVRTGNSPAAVRIGGGRQTARWSSSPDGGRRRRCTEFFGSLTASFVLPARSDAEMAKDLLLAS